MPDVPSVWEFILLALAAWRVFRLISEDDILDRPRRWVLKLDPDWEEGDDPNDEFRFKISEFITCPWCCGFWLSLVVYLFWLWFPHATLVVCMPFALNAIVGLVAKNLDKDE